MFTVTAVVSLAIAIAGNAAIFSLTDGILLRERPGIARPQALVDIALTQDSACCDNISYPHYTDLRDALSVFSALRGIVSEQSR